MKIAVLNFRNIGHPDKGGAEIFLENLCAEWLSLGHEISFFSPKHPLAEKKKYNKKINYFEIGNRITTYFLIRKTLLRLEFDLVIDSVNVRGFNTPNINWRSNNPPKVLAIIHQTAEDIWDSQTRFPLNWIGKKYLEPYWLRVYRNVKVVTVSESSKKSLERFGLQNIEVINPGITSKLKFDRGQKMRYGEQITLVFCARIVAMKQPFDALEILRYLQQENTKFQFKLIVIGSGPLLSAMQEMANELKVNVEFLGYVEDFVRDSVFEKADFFLATSIREGWGMTVSEAASLGCPTIGYDVAGLRDSISLANGILSSPDPHSAARSILKLVESEIIISPTPQGGLVGWHEVAESFLAKALVK